MEWTQILIFILIIALILFLLKHSFKLLVSIASLWLLYSILFKWSPIDYSNFFRLESQLSPNTYQWVMDGLSEVDQTREKIVTVVEDWMGFISK